MVSDTDNKLATRALDCVVELLADHEWEQLTLQQVADRAGVTRVTLWRQLGGKDELRDALLHRFAEDFRAALWPVLVQPDNGAQRLEAALRATCLVIDKHLVPLMAFPTRFHELHTAHPGADDPATVVERILSDGVQDGSLRLPADLRRSAELVFSAVFWPYIHLRDNHHWDGETSRELLVGMTMRGLKVS
ncbi:TetR/AcrR family transcriptional regulator [Streptomyces sp. GQFP]|uniref:TetR/AcrR family transcriptional regulator n=1 Tax=Streptomyces sp. GQFP TaxID=2907545 RepID=UPI001F3052EF|nr:TetR/AcrR family transcriptional regulator [Streptomyces sp. GQFP]UIX29256.1 TetR/AcrR family transcriptional regulator [Streptomyces sp. GQFP]